MAETLTTGLQIQPSSKNSSSSSRRANSRRISWRRVTPDIAVFFALCLVLAPAIAESFDLTLLTADPSRWLQWHQNLFTNWKFGAPYAVLNATSFCLHFYLAALGFTPVVAQHVATKLPLIAAALGDGVLLSKLAPARVARKVRAGWLLSPVVLWVAAGQPQVEPLSALGLLLALYLARRGHLAFASCIAVVGASFEYYPIAYFAVPILLCASLSGTERLKAAARTFFGALIGLLVAFPEALFSSSDRGYIIGGLQSTARTGANAPLQARSIWFPLRHFISAPRFGRLWIEVFAAIVMTILITSIVTMRSYSDELAVAVVAVVVILSVIFEPESLPQFSAIAALGLFLLVGAVNLPVSIAALLPLPGLISWFAQDSWTQFTADVNPQALAHVWSGFPTSYALYVGLGTVFAFGLLAVCAFVLVHLWSPVAQSRQPPTRPFGTQKWRGFVAIALAGACSAYLGVLGVQGSLAAGILGPRPSSLFDAPELLYTETLPTSVKIGGQHIRIKLDEAARNAAQAASRRSGLPRLSLALVGLPRVLSGVNGVGATSHQFVLADRTNRLRNQRGVSVSACLVTLLVHHHLVQASSRDTALQIGGSIFAPAAASPVLPHWEFASFVVPSQVLGSSSAFRLLGRSWSDNEAFVNGPRRGVAYNSVSPYAGLVTLGLAHGSINAPIISGAAGLEIALPSPLIPSQISTPRSLCSIVDCSSLGVAITWPQVPWSPSLTNLDLLVMAAFAVLDALGLLAIAVFVGRSRSLKRRGRQWQELRGGGYE